MTMISLLRKLFSKRDKQVLLILLCSSILVSIVEMIGVSALMCFVSVATNFEIIHKNAFFIYCYKLGSFTHPAYFVIALGIVLMAFYSLRAVFNVAHIYYLNKFVQMRQHYFASHLFKRYLFLDFKMFACKSSATISQAIFAYSAQATQVINGLLTILAESFTLLTIYGMLFYVNWKMTLVLSLLLFLKLVGLIKIFSKKITEAGKRSQVIGLQISKFFDKSFGNYKFLKLLSSEQFQVSQFSSLTYQQACAINLNAVWQTLPRFMLESIGFFILIGVIIYVLFLYRNASAVIPVVSMYALAFYRFLPSLNKIMASYNQIVFNRHVLQSLYDHLHESIEVLGKEELVFNRTITLQHVSFAYESKKPIIAGASLEIYKGEKIGFVGQSGAGKTTLVDVIIGLLKPAQGTLLIDGVALTDANLKAWRQKIGYIPQNIYLFDGTAVENVLCGRKYDLVMLVKVLKQANMYDFLMQKGGLDVQVGEGGIQLSGGQKQRLAIARALYGNPEILVLDEATSSLDNENEEFIMNEIYQGAHGKTLLIIAHRLSTIERCDRVYKIEHGSVIPTQETVKHNSYKMVSPGL